VQFQRQQKANLSVTELCRQLGVSVEWHCNSR
jgi:hypothetical protein